MSRLLALGLALVATASCGRGEDAYSPIRIAPDTCPPDPATGETDLWTEWERITLPNGRPLELRGCHSEGAGWIELDYRGPLPRADLHLVQYHHNEGGGWFLVDAGTGRVQEVWGRPLFPPDAPWFATGAVDLEARYQRNHVDIWRIDGDSIRRVLRLDGDAGEDDWGAVELRWASDDTLEYLRISWLDPFGPGDWFDTIPMRIVREGGRWTPRSGR